MVGKECMKTVEVREEAEGRKREEGACSSAEGALSFVCVCACVCVSVCGPSITPFV